MTLTSHQVELLDRSMTEFGCTQRTEVLVETLRQFGSREAAALAARSPARGEGVARGQSVLETADPGPLLWEAALEPGTGKAVELRRGQVLRVEQIEGGQCADLNCYSLADRRECLHAAGTRVRHGLRPRAGDCLWSRPPAERPMLGILTDTAAAIDTLFPRCTRGLYEAELGLDWHPSCQEIQAEAQREYGLGPDDVHDSVNLFMYTAVDDQGRPSILRNRSRAGDRIELVALIDVVVIPNVCADDIWPTSNFDQRPLTIAIHEGGEELLIRSGMANVGEGDTARDPGQRPQLAPLRRDPGWTPRFERFACERIDIEVSLNHEQLEQVEMLTRAGVGTSAGEVLRACFLLGRTGEVAPKPPGIAA